jgi:hypothetical protein
MIANLDPLDLPKELQELAFQELGETIENRTIALEKLRLKINEHSNEKERLKDTTDRNLIRFLRTKKYDIEKSLQATIDYQKFLNKHEHELQNITREEILNFREGNLAVKEPDTLGRIVIIIRAKKVLDNYTPEYKKTNPKFFLRLNYFLLELLSQNAYAQICGVIIIFSCQGLTFYDQLQIPLMASIVDDIACLNVFQILGIRLKAACTYHEPAIISWLWLVIGQFVNEIMRPRFHFCGTNLSKIHEKLRDVSILPVCLGGSTPDDDPIFTQWIQVV